MKCYHEWFEGKCCHCEVSPSEAKEIDQLRKQLADLERERDDLKNRLFKRKVSLDRMLSRAEKAEAGQARIWDRCIEIADKHYKPEMFLMRLVNVDEIIRAIRAEKEKEKL